MLAIGDRVKVKYGPFKDSIGTIVNIDYGSLPPITIWPDDRKRYPGVFFYECNLEKI